MGNSDPHREPDDCPDARKESHYGRPIFTSIDSKRFSNQLKQFAAATDSEQPTNDDAANCIDDSRGKQG